MSSCRARVAPSTVSTVSTALLGVLAGLWPPSPASTAYLGMFALQANFRL